MGHPMTAGKGGCIPPAAGVSTDGTEVDASRSGRAPENPLQLSIGQRLGGRYRIERQLGEGGMGVVYLAADEQVPGERFALKVLKEELHQAALEQLREEVRRTRKLSHPNIVDVHSVNLDGPRLFVLMEHLEGKPLDALLNEEFGRGMSLSRAWPIIEDVGAALANAHDHNVIHSDVKPANVFITTSGRTKLLDFGIARAARGLRLQAPVGQRALTPAYASCEMLEGKEADRRDDIYSFACVIYEMLCGERPFRINALAARDAGVKFAPIPGLSRDQNTALCRALAFEREARTGSVEALLKGLATGGRRRLPKIALLGATALAAAAAVALTYAVLDRRARVPHSVMVSGTPSAAAPLPNSIAVLPFVNISGDSTQEYFSDGLSEELIDHLVHGTDLKVIARSSSFQFKGKSGDVRSIANTLGVTHLLEGSVRREGRELRIAVQLVRGSDGVQIWSQSYDRSSGGIFKVQDEISDRVAQALRVALRSDHPTSSEPDIRAYSLVLEGNYFKARRNLRDVEKAAVLYQQAIGIDPRYALAWARLASAYLNEEIIKGRPTAEQNIRIVDALNRAIELDPNVAWAYYTRAGFEASMLWDWAASKADIRRVRDIDPRFAYLPSALGDLALAFGDTGRAIGWYEDGLKRDPLDPNMLNNLGAALCAANRLPECLQTRLNLMQLHPEFGGIGRSVGIAHLLLGEFEAALKDMQNEVNENSRQSGLALVYWSMGRSSEADAALHSLIAKPASAGLYVIATVYAYRRQIDEAFLWLDRAYRAHDYGMTGLKTDPLLTNLHPDPRFQRLVHRMRYDQS